METNEPVQGPSPSFALVGRTRVLAVREHFRTISGRKDPVSGQTLLENIKLGWFIHLEFENTGPIAVGVGHDRPSLAAGDVLRFQLTKE